MTAATGLGNQSLDLYFNKDGLTPEQRAIKPKIDDATTVVSRSWDETIDNYMCKEVSSLLTTPYS